MHIVVDVAGRQHQMSFKVPAEIRIILYVIEKRGVVFFADQFFYTMMLLTPPSVINCIVVIAGRRYGYLEEIWINQHCSSTHESSPTVAVNTNPADVNEWIAICHLFCHCFFI